MPHAWIRAQVDGCHFHFFVIVAKSILDNYAHQNIARKITLIPFFVGKTVVMAQRKVSLVVLGRCSAK